MAIIAGNTVNVQAADYGKTAVKPQSSEKTTEKAASLSNDQLSVGVQKGLIPTFKGFGAGMVAGAVGAGGATAATLLLTGEMGGWGAAAVVITGIVGAASGAATGAVTANVTANKWAGAAAGAVVGAAAMRIYSKEVSVAIIGAVGGALAGFVGAAVAKKQ